MKVKVWNDNRYPYKENWRGRQIEIPAHEYVEMEYDDAILFRGTFAGMIRDADGQPDPKGFKMIRVEEPAAVEVPKVNPLLCQSCRYLAHDEKDLGAHLKSHAADVVVDEEAEAEIARKAARKSKVG